MPSGFPTTAWTSLWAAQDATHPEHLESLNRFITRYWKPVFYFLRARGSRADLAEDLTQEFFGRLLERDWLRRADPERGRFRTFLLTLLVRFLSDQGDKRAPRQRVFDRRLVSVESLIAAEDRSYEPASDERPEDVFMRRWAEGLLAGVRGQLRKLCADRGRAPWYDLFEAAHGDDRADSQEALGRRFGLTRDQVRYALEQVTEWFRVLLRAEVRAQVGSEEEVGDEVRDLMALLSR